MQRADLSAVRGARRGPKSIADCASFASLAKKADRLDALDRALRQTLPLLLREHTRFADTRGDRLVFLVSSSAWASRLRLLQSQILATAAALGVQASSLIVKVAPPPPAPRSPPSAKPLSAAAAAHLRAAAASTADAEMRTMFLALAALATTSTP